MFEHLITALDAANARMCSEQRGLLSLVAEVDRCEAWRDSGARDTAHWLSMRYGISGWKAYRWIAAAHALDVLPLISDALARGDLGLDKAVELTRFAVAETEARLLRWALDVSCAAIRRRGDVEARMSRAELLDVERDRSVVWWYYDDGRRFGLQADLPAADGAIVAKAIERVAQTVPVMPGEEGTTSPRPGTPTRWWLSAALGSPRTPIRIAPRW